MNASGKHNEDVSNKILIALIVSSTLLAAIVLFLSCYWICRRRNFDKSNTDDEENLGMFLIIFYLVMQQKFCDNYLFHFV